MSSGLRQQLAILKTLTLYVVLRKPNIVFAMPIGIFSSAMEVLAIMSVALAAVQPLQIKEGAL